MGIKNFIINIGSKILKNKKRGEHLKVSNELSQGKVAQVFSNSFKPAQDISNCFVNMNNISLDTKVNDYIKWNFENMIKGHYTQIGEYRVPIELRNLIEKMAVWYELRYPNYEINRLMPGSGQEQIEVSDVMFNSNPYINSLFDEDADVRLIDWDEFYNTSVFIKSLSWEDRYRFQRPRYSDLVYVDPNYTLHNVMEVEAKTAHLHLTSRGFVEIAEGIDAYSKFKVTNQELVGMHIKDVLNLLSERGVTLPSDNELDKTVNNVKQWEKQKNGLLDAVMYRIIERGGNRMGPRRGFLFAKEFERNIDIPMMYAVDYSDPGLRRFINEYIKAGGSPELVCYVDYFSRTNDTTQLKTVTVGELLQKVCNDCVTKYTPEETNLHQRLVNVLASQVNQDIVRSETVKQLRIQRRLDKSKKTKTTIR